RKWKNIGWEQHAVDHLHYAIRSHIVDVGDVRALNRQKAVDERALNGAPFQRGRFGLTGRQLAEKDAPRQNVIEQDFAQRILVREHLILRFTEELHQRLESIISRREQGILVCATKQIAQ